MPSSASCAVVEATSDLLKRLFRGLIGGLAMRLTKPPWSLATLGMKTFSRRLPIVLRNPTQSEPWSSAPPCASLRPL